MAGQARSQTVDNRVQPAIHFELESQPSGLTYIHLGDVSIGGSRGDAVFDTGAEYSSLTAAASREAVLVVARSIPLRTFNGRVRADLSRPAEIIMQGEYRTSGAVLTLPDEIDWPTGRLVSAAAFPAFSIDFDRQNIIVGHASLALKRLEGGKREGVYFVEVRGRRHIHRFIIDSGATGSRMTAEAMSDLSELPGVTRTVRSYLSADGPGLERGIVAMSGLPSGDQRLPAMVFQIVEADAVPIGGFSGLIGLRNMQALNWHFDGASGTVSAAVRSVWVDGYPVVGFYARHTQETVTVTGLIEGGAAARADVRIGDRIVSLNGLQPFGDSYQAYLETGNCACSDAYVFVVVRDGQTLSLGAEQADLF
ncbi:hypothetical protein [uncultured Brevundimonas sp.]|uniref:hypothetical protein n=1 Tax=uncultured Brevundimonas sp. TaxID=213418 RepID=UPI0030EBD20E